MLSRFLIFTVFVLLSGGALPLVAQDLKSPEEIMQKPVTVNYDNSCQDELKLLCPGVALKDRPDCFKESRDHFSIGCQQKLAKKFKLNQLAKKKKIKQKKKAQKRKKKRKGKRPGKGKKKKKKKKSGMARF